MNTINVMAIRIQPFDVQQKITLFCQGEKNDSVLLDLSTLPESLPCLVKDYEIDKIVFIGEKKYIKNLCKRYRKEENIYFENSKKIPVFINDEEIKF